MKIEVGEHGELILREVFSGVVFKTGDGEEFSICMRDSGFEFKQYWQAYLIEEPHVQWYGLDELGVLITLSIIVVSCATRAGRPTILTRRSLSFCRLASVLATRQGRQLSPRWTV